MSKQLSCLVVDDEPDIRELLVITLERMQITTHSAGTVNEAKHLLAQHEYALCLTDMRLPDGTGLALVQHVNQIYPKLPIAVITAYGSAENAVSALKAGAFDYINKPISLLQLRPLVQSALKLSDSAVLASPTLHANDMIGESALIQHIRTMIAKLARSQAPVFISGESGTGKELAARMIHAQGARANQAFIAVNCGAIPETLMESEFFGYKKGAFTGASQDKQGLFHAANGGTLFLDEVADLPLAMQVKLLRAIQEKKVRMVGGTQEETIDVRIISATHKSLNTMMDAGYFRQDLYYRLNVISLKMPALREISEDIPLFIKALLVKQCAKNQQPLPKLHENIVARLQNHPFQGNIRELENILERALAMCDGEQILEEDLLLDGEAMSDVHLGNTYIERVHTPPSSVALPDYLENIEKQVILSALDKTNQNKTAAAKILGVSFRTLRYRLSKLGLSKEVVDDD